MHETRISGIPCLIDVIYFSKGYPAKINAEPDWCYPGEPDELEWVVCDRRGRPAPWLERKLTGEDAARIDAELSAAKIDHYPF